MNNKDTKKKLDDISSSFCLAKWKQVTLHLQNGHNHSCHHPDTHLVSIEEIQKDPSALHNSSFKKGIRQQMLDGIRPPECEYCWRVEDAAIKQKQEIFSDRVIKSGNQWASPYFNECLDAGSIDNIDPSYVEVSFSNVCNFKCAYCAPHISSKWMEEIKEFGPYNTTFKFNDLDHINENNKLPIPNSEDNPYVEAFWKWWPELYPKLHTFRITGGEPLLTKNTFKVLDWIIENPQPNLNLAINSNLCVPQKNFDQFIEKAKIIQDKKHINRFELFTSAEAHDKKAEYIRTGLNYNEWFDNCDRFLSEVPNSKIVVMATYNLLSITSFKRFLIDIMDLKRKHGTHKMNIDIPYLNHPRFLSIEIATPDFLHYIEEQVEFMKNYSELFHSYEIDRIERIKNMFEAKSNESTHFQKDFVIFVDEYDRRRGTKFLEIFPEMESFYKTIKEDF